MKRSFVLGLIAGAVLVFCQTASAAGQTVSSISGIVVDARDRQSLEGVTVYLFAYDLQPQIINGRSRMALIDNTTLLDSGNRWLDAGPIWNTTVTDTNGKFLFQDLAPGKYRIDLSLRGYEFLVGSRFLAVRRNETVNLTAPFELRPTSLAFNTDLGRNYCGSLFQPGQTADVYVVCADSH